MLDAVIVGSGGAGLSAALALKQYSDNFLLITECGLGRSNTMLAQGGIQIAIGENDSIDKHFQDSLSGGNYKNNKALLHLMVLQGPSILQWLNDLGLDFDRINSAYYLKSCGGISEKRVLSKGTRTGLAIMKVLISETKKKAINVSEKTSLKGIEKMKGHFLLRIIKDGEEGSLTTRRVILCCGGRAKEFAEKQGLGTTNQRCASFEFYTSLQRLHIKMRDQGSFQFHPACISLKGGLLGTPIPETLLSLGGIFLDKDGNNVAGTGLKRDMLSRKILSVIKKGMGVTKGLAYPSVYLDIRGAGKTRCREEIMPFTAFLRKLAAYGIDPKTDKIPVTPMVHYQNGGISINVKCQTSLPGIYAAGEITGGVHGTNRLMGNSLLDILVFGNIAGKRCGEAIANSAL
jgi:aspartate oxidase